MVVVNGARATDPNSLVAERRDGPNSRVIPRFSAGSPAEAKRRCLHEGDSAPEARNDTFVARIPGRRSIAIAGALFLFLAAFPLFAQQQPTIKVPDAAQFVGQPQGVPLTGAALERRTNEIGALLRCPVCQGMSVADSPAEMAVNMKGQVHELLERGYTEEQILKYFELSYSQFVLLKPKFEGVTSMVWLLPAVALLIGAAILFVTFRRLSKAAPATAATPIPTPDDAYVARVRELVGGGKS